MSYRFTLVASEREPATSSDLGHALTTIPLLAPDGGPAVDPVLSDPDPRGEIVENVSGDDQRIHDRKRVTIAMPVDYIDETTKRQIERLFWDQRAIRVCPNYDDRTIASFDLFRDLKDRARVPVDATLTRAAKAYWFDETDQVMYSKPSGEPVFEFNGPYNRMLKVQSGGVNRAAAPHPASGATGWTLVTGTGAVYWETDTPTPVLEKRGDADDGVTALRSPAAIGLIQAEYEHAATGLATTPIVASVLVKTTAKCNVALEDSAGTVTSSVNLTTEQRDGRWHMIKVANPNGSGGTTANLKITLPDVRLGELNRAQQVFVGPVFIGNGSDSLPAECPDWHDGTAVADSVEFDRNFRVPNAMTVSFVTRYSERRCGYIHLGPGSSDQFYIRKYSANDATYPDQVDVTWASSGIVTRDRFDLAQFGLSPGDVMHCVVVVDPEGVSFYVNGEVHADSGQQDADMAVAYGNASNRIGSFDATDDYYMHDAPLCLLRIDGAAWSASEALDHYHTYGQAAGRSTTERFLGRTFTITNLQFRLRHTADGIHQWIGNIELTELGLDASAPLQLQENS